MPTERIALLGGGQLGRMFIENALRYDARVQVLDPDAQCSCAGLADRFVQGSFADRDTVLRFAADADVVGIEIEHVDCSALEELERGGKRVVPAPAMLRIIQDKGLQKEFYREHGIPSADHVLLASGRELLDHPQLLPGFLKTRTGGYDGKGVMAVSADTDPATAFPGPCVLEKRIPFTKELAVMVARDHSGNTVVYEPVEMVFDPALNLVDHLLSPADEPLAVREAAKALALRVMDAFGVPGLLAVELFLTEQGELLVNECAPRAHNSGHATIEACDSSQFDQLLRIYMGWPLGDPSAPRPSAMVNLIGEGGTGATELVGAAEVLRTPGVHIHLYGKRETRTGRKMGHVTLVADDMATLNERIRTIKAGLHVRPASTGTTSHTNK